VKDCSNKTLEKYLTLAHQNSQGKRRSTGNETQRNNRLAVCRIRTESLVSGCIAYSALGAQSGCHQLPRFVRYLGIIHRQRRLLPHNSNFGSTSPATKNVPSNQDACRCICHTNLTSGPWNIGHWVLGSMVHTLRSTVSNERARIGRTEPSLAPYGSPWRVRRR
jgi:hypothetical protein